MEEQISLRSSSCRGKCTCYACRQTKAQFCYCALTRKRLDTADSGSGCRESLKVSQHFHTAGRMKVPWRLVRHALQQLCSASPEGTGPQVRPYLSWTYVSALYSLTPCEASCLLSGCGFCQEWSGQVSSWSCAHGQDLFSFDIV